MDLVFLAKFTGTGVSPGGQDGYEAAVLTCFLIILSGPQLERILGSFLLMRGTQGSGRGGVVGGDRLSSSRQLSGPGIELESHALAGGFFTTREAPGLILKIY